MQPLSSSMSSTWPHMGAAAARSSTASCSKYVTQPADNAPQSPCPQRRPPPACPALGPTWVQQDGGCPREAAQQRHVACLQEQCTK
jgi:hypothetical protein